MLLTFLIAGNVSFSFAGNRMLAFRDATLEQIQAEARVKQQPYFIYFFTEKDRNCRRMDSRTWTDATLISYAEKNYLAVGYDVLSPRAKTEFLQEYKVFTYPTLIFFSPEGKMMGRTEGYVAPETVKSILEKHQHSLDQRRQAAALVFAPKAAPTPVIVPVAAMGTRSMPEPGLSIQDVSDNPAERIVSRGAQSARLHLQVPGYEAYSLTSLTAAAPGSTHYALLVGAFTQHTRVAQEIERLRRSWKGDMWVYCEEIDATLIYKIALGNYETQEQAESFAQAMYKYQKLSVTVLELGQLLR
ncbi:MAG: hypothetical protein EAZ89_16125 [Bacteroidetes bacterium]|nr:MAG: hypothetical protein EAZ89_16125 [Bacteroidota bacterium]